MKKFGINKAIFVVLTISMAALLAVGSFGLIDRQSGEIVGENGVKLVQTPAGTDEDVANSDQTADNGKTNNFVVSGNLNWHYNSDVGLVIDSGEGTVSTTGENKESILIRGSVTITLAGVNIKSDYKHGAMDVVGGTTKLLIADGTENTLESDEGPGIHVTSSSVTIDVPNGAQGTGKLIATGGKNGAGIGGGFKGDGGWERDGNNITINNGNVIATGGDGGAGIGGGIKGSGNNIVINGGHVVAKGYVKNNGAGGEQGAGIGGGKEGNGSHIYFYGGTVEATGGWAWVSSLPAWCAAGIGGGGCGSGDHITIYGGDVTATGYGEAAGIGGGDCKRGKDGYIGMSGTNIQITGGVVTATGNEGAGIGGGCYGSGRGIEISGGEVYATGKYGAGIGGGYAASGNDITITGGFVQAITQKCQGDGSMSTAIGSGARAAAGSNNGMSGNAVVVAKCCSSNRDALEDFNFGGGIAFVDQKEANWNVNMYSDTTITANTKFPTDFTVEAGKALTIGSGATLTIDSSCVLTTKGTLQNNGNLLVDSQGVVNNEGTMLNNGSITCKGDGVVTTRISYDPQGGIVSKTSEYKTYYNKNGAQTYNPFPSIQEDGNVKGFNGWYTDYDGCGDKIETTKMVDPNIHMLYADWEDDGCPFNVQGADHRTDYRFHITEKTMEVYTDKAITISNKDGIENTDWLIKILDKKEKAVNITLAGIKTEASNGPALEMPNDAGFDVNLTLASGTKNVLKTTKKGCAGLQKNRKPYEDSCTLTISGSGSLEAVGGDGGAGIGGGNKCDGCNIRIEGGIIIATGGTNAAGVGAGAEPDVGVLGNNSLSGDAVLMATGGDNAEAFTGGDVFRGIIFTRTGSSSKWGGGQAYQRVNLPGDFELPDDLTIKDDAKLTVSSNVTLTVPDGLALKNDGTLDGAENIKCEGTGRVATLVKYDGQGGDVSPTSAYQTYKDANCEAGEYKYDSFPEIIALAKLLGWYTQPGGAGTEVTTDTLVDLNNCHVLYADWDIPFLVQQATLGIDYQYNLNRAVLEINSDAEITISNKDKDTPTYWGIEVTSGVEDTANVTLDGVNIDTDLGFAMNIVPDGTFNVDLTLTDGSNNILKTTKEKSAGLQKNGFDYGKILTIYGNTGSLTAIGGKDGAGIGVGGNEGTGRNITIEGGNIVAIGGDRAAGIGGGYQSQGDLITIDGGNVTATGNAGGAGIGGGIGRNGNYITINGGTVTATGNGDGAGIGGGKGCSGSNHNKLNGGAIVTATGGGTNIDVLQGFDEDSGGSLSQGIAFVRKTGSDSWSSAMYGNSAVVSSNVEFPADFTIESGNELNVNDGATLAIADGKKLTNNGVLTVNGTISNEGTISGNATCAGNGKVVTLVNYNGEGGIVDPLKEYKTYQDANGFKTYGTLPDATMSGYTLEGWYTEASGAGNKIESSTQVDVNLHTLYANWS